jgi:hypothetical protein|tara:strand:+ start:537 stop:755 length:219 start_codon:yes stop_codon:yes gene_type:complete
MNTAISKFRKFIRKRAINKVNENIAYQQKKVSDYTKNELRELIEKEEKNIISNLKWTIGASAIFAMFGITKF